MGQQVLIADPRDIFRIGLKTVFAEDERVSEVHEVTTDETLKTCLHSHMVDLVVIHQVLIKDIMILPRDAFVILANDLNMSLLLSAFAYGSLGYLSESVSADLLRTLLYPSRGAFLLDPALTPCVMESLSNCKQTATDENLLTRREREIINLLNDGLDRRSVANQLHITEMTLKTHLRNITRKRNSE